MQFVSVTRYVGCFPAARSADAGGQPEVASWRRYSVPAHVDVDDVLDMLPSVPLTSCNPSIAGRGRKCDNLDGHHHV